MGRIKDLIPAIFSVNNIMLFAQKLLSIILIGVFIYVTYKMISYSIKKLLKERAKGRHMEMLVSFAQSTLLYLTFFIFVVTILQELGINLTAILASAGIVGLAVSFGAQTMIKDVIAGIFIIIEDQCTIGDEVEIVNNIGKPDIKGRVSEMNLRTTVIVNENGVYTIPNGSIGYISNLSRKKK
ncbi:MAG: mechanosensitive ion channel domain-containing protein [Candidatus Margulisiibacteriota bacterium]